MTFHFHLLLEYKNKYYEYTHTQTIKNNIALLTKVSQHYISYRNTNTLSSKYKSDSSIFGDGYFCLCGISFEMLNSLRDMQLLLCCLPSVFSLFDTCRNHRPSNISHQYLLIIHLYYKLFCISFCFVLLSTKRALLFFKYVTQEWL